MKNLNEIKINHTLKPHYIPSSNKELYESQILTKISELNEQLNEYQKEYKNNIENPKIIKNLKIKINNDIFRLIDYLTFGNTKKLKKRVQRYNEKISDLIEKIENNY